jgi:hypothetical protein
MKTLQELGYDNFYRRSLPQEYKYTSAVNYDSLFEDGSILSDKLEDGSITSAKISSLTFDKIQGGTATLGGANNQSGVVSVRNESNQENVRIDKNGLTITDDNGRTVIDSQGLVSTSNFPNNGRVGPGTSTAYQIIDTDNTYTTISGGAGACTFDVTVLRNTKILIMGRADLLVSSVETDGLVYNTYVYLGIKIGPTVVDECFANAKLYKDTLPYSAAGYGETAHPTYINYLATLSPGTTTIALQTKQDIVLGTTKLYVQGYNFSYFLLGT